MTAETLYDAPCSHAHCVSHSPHSEHILAPQEQRSRSVSMAWRIGCSKPASSRTSVSGLLSRLEKPLQSHLKVVPYLSGQQHEYGGVFFLVFFLFISLP